MDLRIATAPFLGPVQEQLVMLFQGESGCKIIDAFFLVTSNVEDDEHRSSIDVVNIVTETKCTTGDQMQHME